jgi:hypothetical protein
MRSRWKYGKRGALRGVLLEALESRTLLSAWWLADPLPGKLPVFTARPPEGTGRLAVPPWADAMGTICRPATGGVVLRWGELTPPSMNPLGVQAVAGIPGTYRIGANVNFNLSMYEVLVDWGDGTAPSEPWIEIGGVTRSYPSKGPSASLVARHTYAQEGHYDVTIRVALAHRIKDEGGTVAGDPQVFQTTATVTQNSITGGNIFAGTTIEGAVGQTVPFAASFFEVGDLPASRFYGRFDWGDGTTSDGEVTMTSATTYVVAGAHAYRRPGQCRITTIFGFVPLHAGMNYHYTSYSTALIDQQPLGLHGT